jgi:hypothetical protein
MSPWVLWGDAVLPHVEQAVSGKMEAIVLPRYLNWKTSLMEP